MGNKRYLKFSNSSNTAFLNQTWSQRQTFCNIDFDPSLVSILDLIWKITNYKLIEKNDDSCNLEKQTRFFEKAFYRSQLPEFQDQN